eukprot:GHVU01232334.1.p1 GENE.GHVU01232334.1~~GHVU01232334.1.p1  ORF type:complete len:450 (+),score=94.04 GHVU01232334.1:69-1418(+)
MRGGIATRLTGQVTVMTCLLSCTSGRCLASHGACNVGCCEYYVGGTATTSASTSGTTTGGTPGTVTHADGDGSKGKAAGQLPKKRKQREEGSQQGANAVTGRSTWTPQLKEDLVREVLKHAKVLVDNNAGGNATAKKNQAWEAVHKCMLTHNSPFTLTASRDCFKKMKQEAKKKYAKINKHMKGTGGGAGLKLTLEPCEELISQHLAKTKGWNGERRGQEVGIDLEEEQRAERREADKDRAEGVWDAYLLGQEHLLEGEDADSDDDDDDSEEDDGGGDGRASRGDGPSATASMKPQEVTRGGRGSAAGMSVDEFNRQVALDEAAEKEGGEGGADGGDATRPLKRGKQSSSLLVTTRESHRDALNMEMRVHLQQEKLLREQSELARVQMQCAQQQMVMMTDVKKAIVDVVSSVSSIADVMQQLLRTMPAAACPRGGSGEAGEGDREQGAE